jgi:hypothetical protein
MRTLVAALLLVALGFGLGYASRPAPASPPAQEPSHEESPEARKLRLLTEKLAEFSTHDLEDYIRLKNLEDKYKKADELVGKMILILLADVGLRVSAEQERFARNPPVAKVVARAEPPVAKPSPHPKWLEAEKKRFGSWNADSMLRQTQVPDFGDELSRASYWTQVPPQLNGCYAGDVILTDGSNRIWHMTANIALESDGHTLTGHSLIELSENGKVFSRSSSDGNQGNFRRFVDPAGTSQALILTLGDQIAFQLYRLTDRDMYAGNLYMRSTPAGYVFKGTVALTKGPC